MANVSDDLIHEAFGWIARATEDDFSDNEKVQLETWLDSDPSHRTAFELAEITWNKVEQIPKAEYSATWFDEGSSRPSSIKSIPVFSWRTLVLLGLPTGVAAGLAVLYFSLDGTENIREPTYYETQVAQTEDIKLPDGTRVTLGAETKLGVVLTESLRHVSLEYGEAYFEVYPEAIRPFTVGSGFANVSVLGTSFEVSVSEDSTKVAVSDGTVSVDLSAVGTGRKTTSTVPVNAGQLVKATRQGISPVKPIDPEAIGAWRRGELYYVSTPLSEILSDVDRYYPGDIRILDQSIQSMTLSLTFEAGDTDGLLETLESALPIRIRRLADGTVLVERER